MTALSFKSCRAALAAFALIFTAAGTGTAASVPPAVALPPEKRFAPKTEFQIPVLPTIAHRGFSQKFPENTLAAFRGAIATSADGCEFDVRKTRDDKLIILHDATLARTTKAPAAGTAAGAQKTKINALTYAEISVFDAGACKGAEFAGERVPTLDDALALLAASNCRPVVEIKVENIEAEVIAALKKAKLFDKAVVITFSKTVVKKLRALEPRLPVAWLCGTPKGDVIRAADIFTRQAREIGTNLLDIEHSRLTEPLVAELRRRGFTVWAWTVDKPERAALLRKWGVSAITTNRPDAIATAK